MRQNKYDEEKFFSQYARMDRSQKGLAGAGEWHRLKALLPSFKGKRVLDLGCGYGWHCQYALEQGAASVTGVDLSRRMLARAQELFPSPRINFLCAPMEEVSFPEDSFDLVISSLAFHYLEDFAKICGKVARLLSDGGDFVFSVEHPIFTAQGPQDWIYDHEGSPIHWPVDHYFSEGPRQACFLGEEVTKYHRSLTTYVKDLLMADFVLKALDEPQPEERMLDAVPEMALELRRPMMLILAAQKKIPAKEETL